MTSESHPARQPFVLTNAVAILERTPAALDALLRGLPATWALATEGDATWSPFDVVGHLVHGERTDWLPRARRILEHGEEREFDKFDRFKTLHPAFESLTEEAMISEGLSAPLHPGAERYYKERGLAASLLETAPESNIRPNAAELAALQQVFRGQACLIGSVKSNLGHLDRAAGATNLIKAALALRCDEIPPSRNLSEPNPQLRTGEAQLEVVTELRRWPRRDGPPRPAGGRRPPPAPCAPCGSHRRSDPAAPARSRTAGPSGDGPSACARCERARACAPRRSAGSRVAAAGNSIPSIRSPRQRCPDDARYAVGTAEDDLGVDPTGPHHPHTRAHIVIEISLMS